MDLETFKSGLQEGGYDEVLVKTYAPDTFVDTHSHPFSARALVTAGEMVITCEDVPQTFRAGDIFELPAGRLHTERYGPNGASYLVGRKKS